MLIDSPVAYIVGNIFKQDGGESTYIFFNSRIKKQIFPNHEEGKSYPKIAGIVRKSESVIYRVISRFNAY